MRYYFVVQLWEGAMAACECIVQLDPNDPIKAGKKHKIAKHTASVTFKPAYAKKPKCKGQGCTRGEEFSWSLTKTDSADKLDLFQADEEECLVVGRGEFKLQVTVTVKCYHEEAAEPENEEDGGIAVVNVSTGQDSGSDTFVINAR
jgi:hypothetical protein